MNAKSPSLRVFAPLTRNIADTLNWLAALFAMPPSVDSLPLIVADLPPKCSAKSRLTLNLHPASRSCARRSTNPTTIRRSRPGWGGLMASCSRASAARTRSPL